MSNNENKLICCHCGDTCSDDSIRIDDKLFCCNGCKTVYQLLNDDELKKLYDEINFDKKHQTKFKHGEFDFLEDERIKTNLLDYTIDNRSKVTLYLPQIICSACLYLLENISKLNSAIYESKVDFLRKEVSIVYDNQRTTLKSIVELLSAIGYRPHLNIADTEKPRKASDNRSLYIKLGIAGFCFGNVMIMALPEYLSGGTLEPTIKKFFDSINILFAFLILYAGSDYFKTAIAGLKVKFVSIDVPIALGILVLFLRSVWDIVFGYGPGYVDTLTGLVFFMLTGKIFQQKTYYNLSFDRNYKSYFPLSVIKVLDKKETYIPVIDLKVGDRIHIRSSEIIPADSILISGNAEIDYSFVTGESRPIHINIGERIFAGGKQTSGSLMLETVKSFNQSYLTELWNKNTFEKENEFRTDSIINKVSGYFTFVILSVAIIGFFFWLPQSIDKAFHAFTSVLIIACPCALALTVPFTLGTALRVFSKYKLYLKNTHIIEVLSKVSAIIFDKTGTLTYHDEKDVTFGGNNLTDDYKKYIKSATANSIHPLSRMINQSLDSELIDPDSYDEIPGKGIEALFGETSVKIGSKKWINAVTQNSEEIENIRFMNESSVFVSINNKYLGYFGISSRLRENLREMFDKLKKNYYIKIISGDNDSERNNLENVTGLTTEIRFNQLPDDKIKEIEILKKDYKTLMIGDGLNDIGALQSSDVGIAITENTANFTPGSDGILLAEYLKKLPQFLELAKYSIKTIKLSFTISFLYNIIGLSFALTGELSPVVAAILMPISSISIIALTVFRIKLYDIRKMK